MPVVESVVDATSEEFQTNHEAQRDLLTELEVQIQRAVHGGGAKYEARHKERGRLLVRERIELLLDPESPFLEFSSLAAWGTAFTVGGSVVTGLGVVSGVECVLVAHDPTVRSGAMNPHSLRKTLRALQIARENRLPVLNLVESAGADLPSQSELFVQAGKIFQGLSALSSEGVPTVALVFGNATAGGAYVPGLCDYTVMVDQNAKVFLGGPPLVKMATGEDADDEELGGAAMHAKTSGLCDYLARDEHDCIRIGREIVSNFGWRKLGAQPRPDVREPVLDADELLGVAPTDIKVPFDPREVIGRVVDGSEFFEFKPLWGTSIVCGWAEIHGYQVGILANAQGVIFSEEANKASQFIQLANQSDTPLIFLQNTTGFMVGTNYEQRGIIKDGAKLINAVTNSKVPHITINMAASFGAGNYGMSGRAYDPRFAFAWVGSRLAVMGATQLAGVLSIVAKQSAQNAGQEFDQDADDVRRAAIESQIDEESHSFYVSSRLYDDGVIDPRDTRTVLGMTLSAVHSNVVRGQRGYGVFRM